MPLLLNTFCHSANPEPAEGRNEKSMMGSIYHAVGFCLRGLNWYLTPFGSFARTQDDMRDKLYRRTLAAIFIALY